MSGSYLSAGSRFATVATLCALMALGITSRTAWSCGGPATAETPAGASDATDPTVNVGQGNVTGLVTNFNGGNGMGSFNVSTANTGSIGTAGIAGGGGTPGTAGGSNPGGTAGTGGGGTPGGSVNSGGGQPVDLTNASGTAPTSSVHFNPATNTYEIQPQGDGPIAINQGNISNGTNAVFIGSGAPGSGTFQGQLNVPIANAGQVTVGGQPLPSTVNASQSANTTTSIVPPGPVVFSGLSAGQIVPAQDGVSGGSTTGGIPENPSAVQVIPTVPAPYQEFNQSYRY